MHTPQSVTVEHQMMGCRLCSASLEGPQVAYLLCPSCIPLVKAAPQLLEALETIHGKANDCLESPRVNLTPVGTLMFIKERTAAAIAAAKETG